jgi:magnesium transporter
MYEENKNDLEPNNNPSQQIKPIIRLVTINKQGIIVKELSDFSALSEKLTKDGLHWLDVVGTLDQDLLLSLEENSILHPLVIEDIHSTNQRLKIDYFPDYLFIILKAINYQQNDNLDLEQVSFLIGQQFVFTFQEYPPNQFDPIFERLRSQKSRLRKFGADYLAYALLDLLVDNYFYILEDFSEQFDELQESIVVDPSPELLQTIYSLKKEVIIIRKATWPLREVINQLSKQDSDFISQENIIYFRDIYDHVIQIIDTIETYRDILSGMIDIFMTSISNKMNEIMKVLTIIATIFIPLTFIAGVYGMNFQYMPGLAWRWGFVVILSLMILIAIGMIIFFRKRRWI